jgi:hypothetical protein
VNCARRARLLLRTAPILLALSGQSAASAEPLLPHASIGLLAGEPISLTALLALGDRFALHADVGPSTGERIKVIAAVDVVFLLPDIFGAVGDGFLVPWFGVGPRFAVLKQLAHSPVPLSDTRDHFGLRAPFGISFVADRGVEVFAEIAPGIAFVPSYLGSIDGGLGIRVGL